MNKVDTYRQCREQILSLVDTEKDEIARMASVVGVLHNAFPYYFWTGFYRVVSDEGLVIGPYQGTIGCLNIAFGRGVCGTVAETRETQIVKDVHSFPGHIACDANSQSEIVVPVFNKTGDLIAVFDVDSKDLSSFDETDKSGLEEILKDVFQ